MLLVRIDTDGGITGWGEAFGHRIFPATRAVIDTVIGPMNLGNPVETSVAELAHMVIDLTGSRSEITHKPLPIDDPIQRCPDISQAKSVLEWEPRTALKPGLERTIAYFERLLSDNDGENGT